MKTGAQLYTVRLFTQTAPDFRETMRRVAEIGYETVQLSATGSEITPQIAREIADEMGLKIVLTHSDLNRIRKDTEQLIRDHEVMGCKYIGIGSMPEKYRNPDWIRRFAVDFKEPARMIKDAGMRLMYHNHAFEFEKTGGTYLMDYLLDAFALMSLELRWIRTGYRRRAVMCASGSGVWPTGFPAFI